MGGGALWYDKCRANIKRKAKAKIVQNGDIIKFENGVEFNDGGIYDTFLVNKQGRKVLLWTYKNHKIGKRVTYKGWQTEDFEVVGNLILPATEKCCNI